MTEVDRDFIFLTFALHEGSRALSALDEIDQLLATRIQRQPGVEVRENQRVFDAIRSALQFASNVSKVFWPHSNAKERGGKLRALCKLPARHTLSDRRLRNHIEHMDERLEDWTGNSLRPFLTFELVLYRDYAQERRAEIIGATAVVYDEGANTVLLFGDAFSLTDLRAAVVDVQEHVGRGLETVMDGWG